MNETVSIESNSIKKWNSRFLGERRAHDEKREQHERDERTYSGAVRDDTRTGATQGE